jgi:D-lyxose ketol-isomerase
MDHGNPPLERSWATIIQNGKHVNPAGRGLIFGLGNITIKPAGKAMMKKTEIDKLRGKVLRLIKRSRIVLTPRERRSIEICDFGVGDAKNLGIQVLIYINTERYCAKEIVLLPSQICPEHRHPPLAPGNPGKQETFRCRWGEVYLYMEGKSSTRIRAHVPYQYRDYFTVWKQAVLHPGDQCTIPADTLHWFQAGLKGAVISEFSSKSVDEADVFSDPHLHRVAGPGERRAEP